MPLVSIILGFSIVGGVVFAVKRMIERHEPTQEQIDRAQQTPDPGAQLPTTSTEAGQPVPRDPEFETDAARLRYRQGS